MQNLTKFIAGVAGLFFLGTSWAAPEASKLNAIEAVQVRAESDALLVKIDLSNEIAGKPGSWSIVDPPRLVFDFPLTENKTGKSTMPVAVSDLKSVNIVQTEEMTRLVLNLYRTTQYSAEIQGKSILVRLEKRADLATSAPSAPSSLKAATSTPAASVLIVEPTTIRDITFRRGDEGQAIIAVELTDGTIPVDVRRDGESLKVELSGTRLPERLQSKRDVNDFATPVNSITSSQSGASSKLTISSKGPWFHQSRLAGNQLLIEVKPIPQSDLNRLVQTGEQGQKVSINFFDADATMILRTLAEISGKNVMIDPSLAGRKVTIALDNIAYDQALDVVMAQVNAGMRLRNEVILFGDRAVLQKRDQDSADELARANETAPLVSETFTLSYIKPSDMVALIKANIASSSSPNGAAAVAPAAAPAAPAPAAAGAAPASGGGMLSARGMISPHDPTKKLFVRDTVAVVESIRDVIRSVDVPQKQVMIEARVVTATSGTANSLGVRLRMFNKGVNQIGGGANVAAGVPVVGSNFSAIDAFGAPSTPSLTYSGNPTFDTKVGPAAGAGNVGLMIFNNAATRLLALELAVSESDNTSKAISAPRVVTESGKAATISSTTTITYQSGVNNGAATYAQCVGPIQLTVTPTLTPGNQVGLQLNVQRGTARILGSAPNQTCTTSVDSVNTNLSVENGGTVVIGGMLIEDETQSTDRTPFLGDLPYVGFLFKSTSKSKTRNELLIFITPKIVDGGQLNNT